MSVPGWADEKNTDVPQRLKFYRRSASGRSIRRHIEHRFNAALGSLAKTDPETIRRLPYARWLLDNAHLVRQALQNIEADLPSSYHRQLPAQLNTRGKSIPRMFALIDQFIEKSGLPIDTAALEACCRDYHCNAGDGDQLMLGELWVVPTALRITLLTRLCEAAERAIRSHGDNRAPSEDDLNTMVIAGCITSIRITDSLDWPQFVENTSFVEQTLRRDPSDIYACMDFETRDQYRQAVERLARRLKTSEEQVANAALNLANAAKQDQLPLHHTHVGFYLIDDGRVELESALGGKIAQRGPVRQWRGSYRPVLYIVAVLAVAIFGATGIAAAMRAATDSPVFCLAIAAISLIPLVSVSSELTNFIVSLCVKPKPLCKLDFAGGLPETARSIVVVPTLLASTDGIEEDLLNLERNYLGNADPLLKFALLSDFTDADNADMVGDRELLQRVTSGIDALNERHGTPGMRPFALFHRRRLWNQNAERWMGWERKRGKLEEFNALLRGATDTSFCLQHGLSEGIPNDIVYVITLDADSFMPAGSAKRLIGALAHPLNSPCFDPATGHLSRGYTVLQPRLETNPTTGTNTAFSRFFAGDTLLDLYTHAVSNSYQDLFEDAIFAGKGVYHVDAFRRCTAKAIPENTVLSHDLLEGLMGRAGLVSDIVLLESYPANYLAYLSRLHRWVRGDWQLLAMLTRRGDEVDQPFRPGLLGYWKIFDNMRRSMVSLATFLLLLLIWLELQGDVFLWTGVFALFLCLPVLLRVTLAFRTSLWRWGTIESSARNLIDRAGADLARWTFALVFLPVETFVAADAIARTVYRMTVSHKHMLDWTTAARVERALSDANVPSWYWQKLWVAPTAGLVVAGLILALNPSALAAASALLLLWIASPWLAYRLGQAAREWKQEALSESDRRLLRGIARDTWRFFERFVGPETGWLPPDNVQEYPRRSIADRTSPTNIAMLLMSTVSAYDFGYLGYRQLLGRLTNQIQAIEKLHKHHGHLFNWYSTRDRRPLDPHYVSTVDSGNLVAALMIVQQTLEELPQTACSVTRSLSGLADELDSLQRQLLVDESSSSDLVTARLLEEFQSAHRILRDNPNTQQTVEQLAEHHCVSIEQTFLEVLETHPHRWSTEEIGRFRENARVLRERLRLLSADINHLTPWSARFSGVPSELNTSKFQTEVMSLKELLNVSQEDDAKQRDACLSQAKTLADALLLDVRADANLQLDQSVADWLKGLCADIEAGLSALRTLDRSRLHLISALTTMIDATDFAFLYDRTRNLFHIGYNASIGEYDASYYDLLASEARIASLIAIAKGDVPPKHWMHLGRPLTRIRGCRVLLSWSATAFEYLMPRLFMLGPTNGLLSQSSRGMVAEQIRFGDRHDIPWGVSESGYARFDAQNNYQYYAFGIPKLGLKWDQGERLVTASYASALALPYAQNETVENFRRLMRFNARGRYGFYEALDFGETQGAFSVVPRVVQSYMAHHQGMILVAIGNALHGDKFPRRFHRSPQITSAEYLLFEQLPLRLQTRHLEHLPAPLKEMPSTPASVQQWPVLRGHSELALLSNGRLASRISSQGGGSLSWRGLAATRWDPLREGPLGGSRIYIKDLDGGELQCIGADLLPENTEVLFAPHAVEFRVHHRDLLIRLTITIALDSDTEIRRITITNNGKQIRRVQLTSYLEPCLAPEEEDRRHPAFSKLFIESRLLQEEGVLLYRRRPREVAQQPAYLAHRAVTDERSLGHTSFFNDRASFLGRSRDASRPQALCDELVAPCASVKQSTDACASIAFELEVQAGSTAHGAFLTSVAGSRNEVLEALTPLTSSSRIDWAVAASRMHMEQEMESQRLDSEAVRDAFALMAQVFWPQELPLLGFNTVYSLKAARDTLWRHGISGDRPIVGLCVTQEDDLLAANSLLQRLFFLSIKGFSIDLVFIDESASGYSTPTTDRLRRMIDKQLTMTGERTPLQVFVLDASGMAAGEKEQLIATSRRFLNAKLQSAAQPEHGKTSNTPVPAFVPQPSAPLTKTVIDPVSMPDFLRWRNGIGGFLPDGDGYALLISEDSRPPAPWCNVLANPDFGTLVSDAGSMCTWWGNSSENRLTPWNNDPVQDRTGEALYVRDEETGESWSLTPLSPEDKTFYSVVHGIGETVFRHNRHGLKQRLSVFVDPELPQKYLRIHLENCWPRDRRLTVTYAVEWLLGNTHNYAQHLVLSERDQETHALLTRNAMDRHSPDAVAFVASSRPPHGVSTVGEEFFGQQRCWSRPPGLTATGLSDRLVPNGYPCALYQVHVDIAAHEKADFHFVLGAAQTRDAAVERITDARDGCYMRERIDTSRKSWQQRLDCWQVETPDPEFNTLVNRWLLYQVLSSRVWGRIGFYQASGGFGFRDQLQDVLALLDCDPHSVREHILVAASRQFEEGDVLHWWHDSPLRGVRTRCSDDLLWLVYATTEYVNVSEDFEILSQRVPFLRGEPLDDGELERFAEFRQSDRLASLYEHCCRAIDARITFGSHGLPFVGTGDWNDGENRIGKDGQGESVWMAWFLVIVCRGFVPLCRSMHDESRADYYTKTAKELLHHAQKTAWAEQWYLRGYFDDGTPLGAPGCSESAIDLIAQTWALMADPTDQKAPQLMQSIDNHLADDTHRLIKLLAPPFDELDRDPGYIGAYPPGVRENGGQYTHAAVWAAWAATETGDAERAMTWFDWLNPVKRIVSDEALERYRLEPFVMPGDIYAIDSLAGRGGWSWYTGSAAWMYRLAMRQLLGLRRRGKRLFIRPCLPKSWAHYTATFQSENGVYRIQLHSPSEIVEDTLYVTVNGKPHDLSSLSLDAGPGIHEIEVFASDAARRRWLSECKDDVCEPASP